MTTNTVIAEMLKENTGRHMLDSGGASGRSWQRNADRDFDAEPRGSVSGRYGVEATHNLYHWLGERLEYAPELDAELATFGERPERERESYFADVEDWIAERFPDAGGIYGEGAPVTVNTYNHDSALSQVIQFTYLEDDDDADGGIVVLMIHGGADVRGGYTRPRVFRLTDELSIFDDSQITLWCPRCETFSASEDGGYSFHIIDGGYSGEADTLYTRGDTVFCRVCLADTGAIVRIAYGC